jgi:hypothetical protein
VKYLKIDKGKIRDRLTGGEFFMLRDIINSLAEQVLDLDESELSAELAYYKQVMEDFAPTREWERAVIAFFLINSLRVKSTLFHGHSLKNNFLHLRKFNNPRQVTRLQVIK